MKKGLRQALSAFVSLILNHCARDPGKKGRGRGVYSFVGHLSTIKFLVCSLFKRLYVSLADPIMGSITFNSILMDFCLNLSAEFSNTNMHIQFEGRCGPSAQSFSAFIFSKIFEIFCLRAGKSLSTTFHKRSKPTPKYSWTRTSMIPAI